MGESKEPAVSVENEVSSAAVRVIPYEFKGIRVVAAIVYGLSAIFTVLIMLKANAPLHTFKDFLAWLLLFLLITFIGWLVAFLLVFLFVKYKSRVEE
jgi:hypothetical protein